MKTCVMDDRKLLMQSLVESRRFMFHMLRDEAAMGRRPTELKTAFCRLCDSIRQLKRHMTRAKKETQKAFLS